MSPNWGSHQSINSQIIYILKIYAEEYEKKDEK